jgi:MarR family transcriptional regulator for hemolysin
MSEIREIWLHAHNMLRTARQIINENLHPLNLSSAEGNILLHLWTQGQEMGQEQLVEQLDVSKPAVSRALNSLEKKGYVTRQPDPDDKRAHRVLLTEKALEVGPTIEQIYNHIYTLAMQGISQEEFDYFIKLFGRISENFAHEQAKMEGEYRDAA